MHFKHQFCIWLVKLLSGSAKQLFLSVCKEKLKWNLQLFYILDEDLQLLLIVGIK